ncbi:MAG: VanZ family protein [Oscillospiraceae bacterium]|nr:VanZ family protein [Oscillospiraceae bacterium]
MAKEEKRTPGQILLRLACLVYGALMIWLLFGQRMGTGVYGQQADSINLIPLKTIRMYISMAKNSDSAYLFRHAVVNLVGNVVMFVPLGFFLPYIARRLRSFWKTVLCALVLILAIETIQYFTLLGACDVDDLILNLAGVILGYISWKILRQ